MFYFVLVIAALIVAIGLWKDRQAGKLTRLSVDKVADRQQRQIDKYWEFRNQNIPRKFFGHGCDNDFSHYLTGTSQHELPDLNAVKDWLLQCHYVSDRVGQSKRDHWLHPDEFDQHRAGDCEDSALWTWRQLMTLGYPAEFMVGKWLHDGRIGTHAWVLFRQGEDAYVFETTARNPEKQIKPLEQAKMEYIPFASIDTNLGKKVYMGMVHWLTRKDNK